MYKIKRLSFFATSSLTFLFAFALELSFYVSSNRLVENENL